MASPCWTAGFFYPDRMTGDAGHADPREFRRLSRDIYVPAGNVGFWQGAFRDIHEPAFAAASLAVREAKTLTVDLLYGDHEGGQRAISRFALTPMDTGAWLVAGSRHWNLDRAEPRR